MTQDTNNIGAGDQSQRRAVRSYVIREGRMTQGQRRALNECWNEFGLDDDTVFNFEELFKSTAPVFLEIGFGMGDSLFEMAEMYPDRNFVGIEVHRPGVGHLLIKASEAGLTNLKVVNADSVHVVSKCVLAESLDGIQVFFPDPWHKKKHHKRRLLDHHYLLLLADKLKIGGVLHVATDWKPYAEEISDAARKIDKLRETTAVPKRPVTKYEARGLRLGHEVTDLAFTRLPG